jgi:2-polyprenyl-6-methoxyphenol hydroxylase-like FAD-dependent oxidoreductase
VESVVIDLQPREGIEETIRAGILEQGTVDLLRQTGLGERCCARGSSTTASTWRSPAGCTGSTCTS